MGGGLTRLLQRLPLLLSDCLCDVSSSFLLLSPLSAGFSLERCVQSVLNLSCHFEVP